MTRQTRGRGRARCGAVRVVLRTHCPVIEHGVVSLLADFADRVVPLRIPLDRAAAAGVGVVLFDVEYLALATDGVRDEFWAMLDEPRVRVVLFGGDARPHLREAALSAGAVDWVPRSADGGRLVRAIEGDPPEGSRPERRCGERLLTPRQSEILGLVVQGHDSTRIAAELCVSENTLKSHLRELYRRIGVRSRAQAVSWAMTEVRGSEAVPVPGRGGAPLGPVRRVDPAAGRVPSDKRPRQGAESPA